MTFGRERLGAAWEQKPGAEQVRQLNGSTRLGAYYELLTFFEGTIEIQVPSKIR